MPELVNTDVSFDSHVPQLYIATWRVLLLGVGVVVSVVVGVVVYVAVVCTVVGVVVGVIVGVVVGAVVGMVFGVVVAVVVCVDIVVVVGACACASSLTIKCRISRVVRCCTGQNDSHCKNL